MRLIEYKDRQELPDENAVVVFNHIPKTGGVTIERMLMNHYGEEKYRLYLVGDLVDFQLPRGIRCISEHGASGIHGFLPKSEKGFCFTFMRHPLKRWISNLKHLFFMQETVTGNTNFSDRVMERIVYEGEPNIVVDWLGNGEIGYAEEILFEHYAFFGITELFAESLNGLSGLLPWLKGKTVISANVARKDGIVLGKLAEEYFLEKNSKDIELYENALKEFRKRMPQTPVRDVLIKENTQSYQEKESRGRRMYSIIDAMRGGDHVLKVSEVSELYYSLEKKEHIEIFLDYVRKFDLLGYKFYAYLLAIRLGRIHLINAYGLELFDGLDVLDKSNRIQGMIRMRLNMLTYFIEKFVLLDRDGFPARYFGWLSSLAATPGWRAVALHTEALLREKHVEPAAACDRARKAVEIDPGNLEFHDTLCRLLLATGLLDEAEGGARSELAVNPDSEWALRQLGLVLAARDERQEAKEMLRNALGYMVCIGGGGGAKAKRQPLLAAGKQGAPAFAFLGGCIRRNRDHCPANV